jgi:2-iminobutanoate/2-iminopropanoate deaminase
MKPITDKSIPAPKGHYSPAIEHNGMLYISGQLPIDPETGNVADAIEDQVLQALKNVERFLIAAGSSREKVLQARVYISDIALWEKVNAVYAEFFGTHKPARAVVPVGPLHYGCLVEIEVIATV